MTAPTFTGDVSQVEYTGPGLILMAPYAVDLTLPTFAAASSVFTNSWANDWVPVGYTDDGIEFTFTTTVNEIEAAETLYPLAKIETKKDISVKFAMLQNNEFNLSRAMNGGTFTTASGSGATKVTKYSPPTFGGAERSAIGWISQDNDEALIVYKTWQQAALSVKYGKIGIKWMLNCDFAAEIPDPEVSADPWNRWAAGERFV